MMHTKWLLLPLLLYVLSLGVVTAAPMGERPSELAKTIGVIHHLTYLIDYLVQYVIRENDRKTPQDAVDFYQKALVEGRNQDGSETAREYKPSADRARQETEIIAKMMKV